MSIKAISLVWERSKAKGSELLLMLAIADYAHDDGTGAWPSQGKLAQKTRLSRQRVNTKLAALEKMGELIIHRGEGKNGVNVYDIHLPAIEEAVTPSLQGVVTPCLQAGVTPSLQPPVTPSLQNPSSYPSVIRHAPPPEKSGGGKERGLPPKDATRDGGYLPTAEEQMGMLIPGAARIDEAHTEALTAIERSSWRIGGDARDALVEFMVATHLGIPRPKSVRADWDDALTYQAHEYGVSQLKTLYPAAVQYMRDRDLSYTRPASLTTALAKVAAEAKTAQPKQAFEWEWKSVNQF